ncbi:MAG: hypothetical protein ABSF87_18275 [Xanthobacteraceae bacterium]
MSDNDQDETMLGQGTVGMELDEQVPEIDTLLVSVGGGGSHRRRDIPSTPKLAAWRRIHLRRAE